MSALNLLHHCIQKIKSVLVTNAN